MAMTLETILIMLLYVAAGWVALLGLKSLQNWRHTGEHKNLIAGGIDVLAVTVAIAYLAWWPLLLALTWKWLAPLVQQEPKR